MHFIIFAIYQEEFRIQCLSHLNEHIHTRIHTDTHTTSTTTLAWGPQELKKEDRTKLWTPRIPKVGLTQTRTLLVTKEFPGLAKAVPGKDIETHGKL